MGYRKDTPRMDIRIMKQQRRFYTPEEFEDGCSWNFWGGVFSGAIALCLVISLMIAFGIYFDI